MILLTLILTMSAHASPDRIGNGGGIWTCFNDNKEIQSSVLVDFFEAENEFSWRLIKPSRSEPMQIVDDISESTRQRFPDYADSWARVLSDVKARIHLFNGKLTKIEDSLFRGSPPPSLCRSDWEYVQFANYNDKINLVQIRKDFWESANVAALDKAGLVWHEAIYRWMREEFSEENSVRARQIVGVLFSTMGMEESRAALKGILQQGDNEPRPDHPIFVCQIRNGVTNRYFLDYGTNELAAKNQAVKTCRSANEQLGFHCQYDSKCDSFVSMKQAFTCAVTHGVNNNTYTETGRSLVEAEAKARRACSDANSGAAIHCMNPVCQ